MSVGSEQGYADESSFPWPGNTVWVDDPSNVEAALEDSDYFEAHGEYGMDEDGDVSDSIGSQYVAPEAGIVVTVNYTREGENAVKAATMEESAQGFATVDEVSESAYHEVVDHYVNDVLVRSDDVNDVDDDIDPNPQWEDEKFRESVEDWFEASYEEAQPTVMTDGGIPVGGMPVEDEGEDEEIPEEVEYMGKFAP